MNNCHPRDMTFSLGQGQKTVTFGELLDAYEQLNLAQMDLDSLRVYITDTRDALSIVCSLVMDTVGQLDPETRNEKERELMKTVGLLGYRCLPDAT